MFNLDDYDYDLPPELIAQSPALERDRSRLLVVSRSRNRLEHSRFDRIAEYLKRGDLLVVNDTRVVPARLIGHKESGGRVELLVLEPYKEAGAGAREGYCCLVKSSKGVKPGQHIYLKEGLQAEIVTPIGDGKATVRFPGGCRLLDVLDEIGEVPLPPYVIRGAEAAPVDDRSCYQTEFARNPGAVAAPTAGLHFTKSLLESLECGGIRTASITLHVGYGTFAPIRCDDIREHRIHSEFVEMGEEAAEAVNSARREGRRVVAVGTTVVRSLEWILAERGKITAHSGSCGHYIYPGYRFGVIDCMITNFHLPKSSLILLVSAFAGRDLVLSAYTEAVRQRYRFFSYGDATLIE